MRYERSWSVRWRKSIARGVRGCTDHGMTAIEAENRASLLKKQLPDHVVEVLFMGEVWMEAGHVSAYADLSGKRSAAAAAARAGI